MKEGDKVAKGQSICIIEVRSSLSTTFGAQRHNAGLVVMLAATDRILAV